MFTNIYYGTLIRNINLENIQILNGWPHFKNMIHDKVLKEFNR